MSHSKTSQPAAPRPRVPRSNSVDWRVVSFAAVYLTVQFGLITRAHFTEEKKFGFWMFSEASRYSATLFRETYDGKMLRTFNGAWQAEDAAGRKSFYRWNDFVNEYRLADLEYEKRAKGRFATNLIYLRGALDYIVDRIPRDAHTARLHLTLLYKKAGEDVRTVKLQSAYRRRAPQ